MKKFLSIILLIAPFCSYAEEAKDITLNVDLGASYVLPGKDYINPENNLLAISTRYYQNDYMYFYGKLTSWNKGNKGMSGGNIVSIGIGGRTPGKIFFEGSLGVGYLFNPDGNRVEYGYLTNHKQYEINLGTGYHISKDTAILVGLTHFSNCQKVCNLSEDGHSPNLGRDFVRIGIEIRL